MSDLSSLPEAVELNFDKYEPAGGAMGAPVLLGHGLFLSKKHWEDTPKKLADQTKRTVYTVDLRDHGDSPRTDELTFKGAIRSFDSLDCPESQPSIVLSYNFNETYIRLAFKSLGSYKHVD